MAAPQYVALDAMGGDFGPSIVVAGAALALEKHPTLQFLMFGDQTAIERQLKDHPALAARSLIRHTDSVIASDAKPSQALRRGKGTSMWRAVEAVRDHEAAFAVSAGNTGALMAVSRLILRTLPGIDRPALAGQWPTIHRPSIVLDVGANIGASARELCHFALMGAAMARSIYGVDRPTVGLLNVGTEEIKGAEEVKQAHAWLRDVQLSFDYRGYIEGDKIGQGIVDVVVCEGFTGNIALKTAEGTAKQIATYLREAMTSSLLSKAGALLASGGFKILKERSDPRRSNGGTFLGLNGIAIKSHGGTDAYGFASAIEVGYGMAASGIIERLTDDLAALQSKLESIANAAAVEADMSKTASAG
jgi:phosphate acyltransferase